MSRINGTTGHALVAVRNGADKLQLIPYYVNALADAVRGVGRCTESTAGVGQIEATYSPTHDGAVVAFQNSTGALSVINYGVTLTAPRSSPSTAAPAPRTAPAIDDVDVATVVMGRGVSEVLGRVEGRGHRRTAQRGRHGVARTWQIDTAGTSVTLVDTQQVKDLATNTAFTAADVDVTVTGSLGSRELALVSVATPSGLRVQTWQISSAGLLGRVDQWDRRRSQRAVVGQGRGAGRRSPACAPARA